MTNTMTIEDEEKFIIEQLLSARHAAKLAKQKLIEAENFEEATEQALLDYMLANGLKKTEAGDFTVTLGESESVDVSDIDSVPEKYIRTKVVKEVNKALIRAEKLPPSNWLSYTTKPKLTIKHKDS